MPLRAQSVSSFSWGVELVAVSLGKARRRVCLGERVVRASHGLRDGPSIPGQPSAPSNEEHGDPRRSLPSSPCERAASGAPPSARERDAFITCSMDTGRLHVQPAVWHILFAARSVASALGAQITSLHGLFGGSPPPPPTPPPPAPPPPPAHPRCPSSATAASSSTPPTSSGSSGGGGGVDGDGNSGDTVSGTPRAVPYPPLRALSTFALLQHPLARRASDSPPGEAASDTALLPPPPPPPLQPPVPAVVRLWPFLDGRMTHPALACSLLPRPLKPRQPAMRRLRPRPLLPWAGARPSMLRVGEVCTFGIKK